MLEEEFGSDTDDEDFVPEGEGHDVSEEEHSGDEEEKLERVKEANSKGRRKKESTFGRGVVGGSESNGWQDDLREEKKEKEDEIAKQKAQDIWASFKSDVSTKTQPPSQARKPPSSMSSLFSTDPPSSDPKHSTTASAGRNRLSSLFDPSPSPSPSSNTAKVGPAKPAARSLLTSIFDDDLPKEADSSDASKDSPKDCPKEATAGKIEITKVFDFAGESVKVTKEVDTESEEAKKHMKLQETQRVAAAAGQKRGGGLASVVGSIGKKAKMGCLDKSKLDWNKFVEDQGIKEELSTHNRGKGGYVEKQMFLERADLRQFELEKAVRDKNRKSLMK